jgi:hypothetical protein
MKALQYVEIDVPFCSLTYGTAPCGARITSSYDPVPAGFDGSTTYLKRAGGLTGAADSKLLTISCWLRLGNSAGGLIVNADTALNGTTTRTGAGLDTTNFYVTGYNSAGTHIVGIQTSALPVGPWVHVLASVDLSSTSKRHLYVNDVSDMASIFVYTNDTMDFTMADWGIGATAGGSSKFQGSMADLWFAPGVYLDFSNSANR